LQSMNSSTGRFWPGHVPRLPVKRRSGK